MSNYMKQLFEVETDFNVAADIDPAISIDHNDRLVDNFQTVAMILGITHMIPMDDGTLIKRWKTTVTKKNGKDIAEGEIIPLSKVTRVALDPIELKLQKHRRATGIESVQKNAAIALNLADDELVKEVRKDVKDDFFAIINAASGTAAAGANLQAACANLWGALGTYFEDTDATPVFFINNEDLATYLGTASLTTQNVFGLKYLENFLGLGNAIVTPGVTKGKVYATAVENLNGAYVPVTGDVANMFGLTYDETGLVGMTHSIQTNNASIESLLVHGVKFYVEDTSGVFASTIGA